MATFTATNGLEVQAVEGRVTVMGPWQLEGHLSADALEAVVQWLEMRSIGGA